MAAAAHRWGRPLLAERDRRVAERVAEDAESRALQAVRGRVTHQLDRELLDEMGKTPLAAEPATGKGFIDRTVNDPKWVVKYLTRRTASEEQHPAAR